jgi:polysaccharide export outer membrane protein
MKVISSIVGLFLLIALQSCVTQNLFVSRKENNSVEVLDSVFLPNPNYEYRIQKNDKISISVWDQDDLSIGSSFGIYNSNEVYGKWLMVDFQGNVEAPTIGSLQIENKTIIELKDTLRSIYSEWVKTPIVDIKILNRQITVLGEVREPQVITIDKEKNSLINMITLCKGFDFYADMRYVKVFRQVGQDVHVATLDLTKSDNYLYRNIDLYSGDVVVVPSKKHKVFDKRISTIIPFTTAITAAAIFMGLFNK